jgi:putative cell wall-binding protein
MEGFGRVTVERTRIIGNTAPDDGGGIDCGSDVLLTIENSVIAGNQAQDEGGAIRLLNDSEADIVNSTIYGNRQVDGVSTTPGAFAGVFVYASGGADCDVVNSILWAQTDQQDVQNATISHSITQKQDLASLGNTVGTGVIHTDPMFFDAANDDFRLLIGSPAIDTAAAAAAPADDIDGTSRPQDGDGDGTAADDMGAWERPGLEISRYSGLDRYETAALIATGNFSDADVAILASGENFPDALAAAGLAGSYGAPLLLTRTASLPSYTTDALSDLGVTDVIIVGGSGAVSDAVANTLDATYDVSRIWGPTRYETAAEVAAEIADREGGSFAKRAFIARGDEYPDALAISPFAYDAKVPILLTYPDLLAPATAEALDDLDIEGGVVTGGAGAVSAAVKSGVDAITTANGGAATVRYGGIDRYQTAAIIAEDGVEAGYGSWDYVGVATGLLFPDALAGGVAAGANRGVILLTRTDTLPSYTSDALAEHGAEILYAEVYGGPGAVAPAVEDAVFDAMGW